MKKFKFQLAALLKVTKMKKEQSEIEFAEASQRLQDEQSALLELEKQEAQNLQAYYETAKNNVKIDDLVFYSSYFDYIKDCKAKQAEVIAKAETERLRCLQNLQQAMRKLKTIEQLREKRFEQFKENLLAEEQKELDEIGLNIFTRMVR